MIAKKVIVVFALSGAFAAVIADAPWQSAGAAANVNPRVRAHASVQTIDAKTEPAAAGKAVNEFCQTIANCKFVGTAPIAVEYDAPRILGDALYNCGEADAEDEVKISDERSESTNIEEELSTKVKLGFIGLEHSAIEVAVDSKQLDEVATSLEQTNAVVVAPGTVGYTETRVPTAYVTGETDITSGVNLIKVTNVELTYPGYGNAAINKIDWTDVHKKMDDQERHEHCAGLPSLYPASPPPVTG